MTKNYLLNNVRLPFQIVRGSFETRQQKAAQFTHKIVNELSGQIDYEGVHLSKLGRMLKRLLPDNFNLFVRKNSDKESYAQLDVMLNKDNYIAGEFLELEPDKNGRITASDMPYIAHEIRHLADFIFHPKILVREQAIAKKGMKESKYADFYDKQVYVQEMNDGKKSKKRIINDIRNKTMNILRGLSVEDKINILQCIRYNLITEINAYRFENKIAKKYYKKHQPVYQDTLDDKVNEFMFNEKIELIKNIIFELIQKERRIHRAKLKKLRQAQNK